MLKDVVIKDFRSCAALEIHDIGGILALVGRNGAGKTNILRAVEWAAKVATSTEPPRLEEATALGHRREVKFVVNLEGQVFRYSVSVLFSRPKPSVQGKPPVFGMTMNEAVDVYSNASSSWERFVTREDERISFPASSGKTIRMGVGTSCLPALASVLPADDPVNQRLTPLRKFLRTIRYYPLDEPCNAAAEEARVVTQESYTQWLNAYKTTLDPGDTVVRRILYLWLERRDTFDELTKLLGPDGLDLLEAIHVSNLEYPPRPKNQEKPSPDSKMYHFVSFMPAAARETDTDFDYGGLSLGTRRVIRILVSMLFDGSSVLLMEQPEDAIHSALMKKLMGLLQTYADPQQFVLASHSSDVFNKLNPEEIRLVTMTNGKTALRALTPQEIESAKGFMEKDGALSEFLETVVEA